MGSLTLEGDPEVTVILKRSSRSRRMTLRVSHIDGRATLTMPTGVPEGEGLAFAQTKRDWILRNLDKHGRSYRVHVGGQVPLLGNMKQVIAGAGRRVQLDGDTILVPGHPDTAPRRLGAFLKELARSELTYASDMYAAKLGRSYKKITLRDTRSRWGSCTSAGGLMYSWRLIMAPAEVLAYVAAHEVAHLEEMNHSPAFWKRVEDIHGPYKAQKNWLRKHGHVLHQYRFDA